MPAEFRVLPAENGDCQFEFVNGKGEKLMTSSTFSSKETAEKAIQDVRVGSMMSQFIAKGKAPSGEFFFIVNDTNGTKLAQSILFSSEMQFDNALHNFRDSACIAEISYSD